MLMLLGTMSTTAGFAVASAAHANVYYVNTAGDPGPPGTTSLRQAVAFAGQDSDPARAVSFDPSLVGSTITLTQGAIVIEQPMEISGFSERSSLTVSGQDTYRIFEVGNAQPVAIRNMTLTHGRSSGCGGAVYGKGSQAFTIFNVEVTQSSAAVGGGICVVGAQTVLSVKRSRVSQNFAAFGGGVYVGQGAGYSAIGRSTISGNTARSAGGGVFLSGVEHFVVGYSLIVGNSVPPPTDYSDTSQGGGILASGIGLGGLKITASTITANYSYAAGAAIRILDAASGDRTRLMNVTVTNNNSAIAGSAISAAGSPKLYSTLVASNPGGDLSGTFASNYSLIKDPAGAQITGSHNLFGADPQLGPLADHGGLTYSMLPVAGSMGIFSMLPAAGSPAVNAGHHIFISGEPNFDQRGYPLVSTRDIGAAERQYPEDVIFRNTFGPS